MTVPVSTLRLDAVLSDTARRQPDRPALVSEDAAVTYAELDRAVTGAAARLPGPGTRIGVLARRGPAAIVGILAALRAGAWVAPLDPALPPARTARILAGGGLDHLLVTKASTPAARQAIEAVPGGRTGAAGAVSADLDCLTVEHPGLVDRAALPVVGEPGGYLLFTSGSTGWPKGVLLSHGNVLHFARWAATELRLGPTDRIAAQSPLTFDLSTFDLFSGMLAGATVDLIPEELRAFPRQVGDWLRDRRATVFYAVPTLYQSLDPAALAGLRIAAFAGEPFPPRALEALLRELPDTEFYNLYGPTETNVCTYHRMTPDWTPEQQVPIGLPIADTTVAVLDDGELAVAGPTVLQGYLDRGALRDPTVELTFPDGVRRRAYRTGDLVRYDDKGRLVLVGRADDQIKRHGYRIDLHDIEAALREVPGVGRCAVVRRDDELWAYLVAPGRDPATVAGPLRRLLPAYMLPDRFVAIDALPVNAHGKVDRRALAEGRSEGRP